MAADDLGSMGGYMSDGEMLTINAPKDSVSVYWENNLKIPNSFGEITVVTFPPCQDSELRLFFLYFIFRAQKAARSGAPEITHVIYREPSRPRATGFANYGADVG
jgi:hypothetical protein